MESQIATPPEERKTTKHQYFGGIVLVWVGVRKLLCVLGPMFSCGEEETHKQNARKYRDNPGNFCLFIRCFRGAAQRGRGILLQLCGSPCPSFMQQNEPFLPLRSASPRVSHKKVFTLIGARTLVFVALLLFLVAACHPLIARTPFCATLWRSPIKTCTPVKATLKHRLIYVFCRSLVFLSPNPCTR